MAVIKEFRCTEESCGGDFAGLVAVCPRCGSRAVKRVFLTPPGINRGATTPHSARSIDKLLAREFARQHISDFSNCGGENKVRYKTRVQQLGPGTYATSFSGLAQPPIRAFIGGSGDFSPLERASEYGFNRANVSGSLPWTGAPHTTPPENRPIVDQGSTTPGPNMIEVARSTPLPASLAARTTRIK